MAVELQAGEVRPYDFRRPVRMSSGIRTRLAADHARLARGLAEALADRLGVSCEVAFQEVVEVPSDHLFETPYDPVFDLAPLVSEGQFLFQMQASLAQAFVDRLLGGLGESREVERESTDIEAALLGLVARDVRAAVVKTLHPDAAAGREPVFMSAAKRHEVEVIDGVTASFQVRSADAAGGVHLFYSYDAVIDAPGGEAARSASGPVAKVTREQVDGVRLPIQAQWPPSPIQLRDLAALRVGDVVHLDHKVGEEVEVLIGGQVAFRGHPGVVEDAFGVQITRAV